MNVQGIGHQKAWEHPQPGHDAMKGVDARETARVRTAAEDAPQAETTGDAARGVIRLLQEGHFKGVADVRLRINFFDELQAVGAANAGQSLESGVQDLISALGDTSEGPLATLLQSGELTEEDVSALVGGFAQTADGILEKFRNGEAGLDETLGALETALLSLAEPPADPAETAAETIPEIAAAVAEEVEAPIENTEDLSTTITPAPADGEGDIQAAGEAADEPEATPVQDPYESLRQALAGLMDDLKQSVADSQALPPLSPPQGNGQAYAKFLGVYTAMLDGTGSTPQAETPGETFEAQV